MAPLSLFLLVTAGYPQMKEGYLLANEKPGWGVVRAPDGTVINQ
jgi:hypothetical protein